MSRFRTKGLTLEEMDEVFGDTNQTAISDQERLAVINKRIGLDRFAKGDEAEGGRELRLYMLWCTPRDVSESLS